MPYESLINKAIRLVQKENTNYQLPCRLRNQKKTIMMSDLPHDLESEILARVPFKSLAKLQTTCKRWYAWFKRSKVRDEEQQLEQSIDRGDATFRL